MLPPNAVSQRMRDDHGGGTNGPFHRQRQPHDVDVDPNTPLLWVIREQVGLTGTKYGCGIAQCGACTVHIDGVAVRSCSMPVSAVEGKKITTIEGSPGRHPAQGAAGLDRARRAAMRLLPDRHDHGGRGAAEGEAETDRRRHRRRRSPISAAAAPSSRCARRSTRAANA